MRGGGVVFVDIAAKHAIPQEVNVNVGTTVNWDDLCGRDEDAVDPIEALIAQEVGDGPQA